VDESIYKAGAPDLSLLPNEPMSIDEIIDTALGHCVSLPHSCDNYVSQIKELRSRLARGRLHLAVLGQFNRGKSTFINALIGLKILPTSVLPITSVPTLISYGPQIICTVRFLNKKPDLIVRQSLESIVSTLRTYVAEENNPRNQLCVKEVEITCPSPVLENGTVLIDTPGFGSTHLHNTRTALESLSECDAALFLLSADPPMTQTEVEFLKQVNMYVPRLFFILNKIDLLNNDDLPTVDRFIRQILITQLGYSHDVKLFHVCAVKGERANERTSKDPDWVRGNMEVVKAEILEFMVREKYFTLSQALNDKFKESLDGICDCLLNDIHEFTIPVELLTKEKQELLEQSDLIKKNITKELALVGVGKNAVLKFVDEQIEQAREKLKNELSRDIENILMNPSVGFDSLEGLSSALDQILFEKFSLLWTALTSQANKPLKKAVAVHNREYSNIAESVKKCVNSNGIDQAVLENLEKVEIAIDESWQKVENRSDLNVERTWIDFFKSKQSRKNRIKERWESALTQSIEENLTIISVNLRKHVEVSFDRIHSVLSGEYHKFVKTLENAIHRKETALKERSTKNDTRLKSLQNSFEAFEKVKSLLH